MPVRSMRSPGSPRSSGFTLIEILVSIVVLSMGLLGVAKLVMAALRANDSAYMRSQATALAYALLDDMRSNRDGAISGYYNVGNTIPTISAQKCEDVSGASACTDESTLAQYQIYVWQQRLANALPVSKPTITTAADSTTGLVTATVTIAWDDSLAQGAVVPSSAGSSYTASITIQTVL